ncbi:MULTISPECIES: hypothetical protein [unclassified Bradyrhizobium]|uniref:hypothetical protein n=1 Tax=unclassified Bradyrhizobium TaxID=2631580 RepID=UPI001FF7D07D|nr:MULTISPECIES: hypothetical protein [unclassified Bradyrhizobium]MCK1497782.1 hypothetical protein [Bradyrhizobium sp. 188]UPJ84475.1 hypothetical protein IVB17_01825 [Bradyrhizobium sp. 184]UPJ92271.1 hypothetical protein IVB16_01825 [Bradyrhizobium sp. 183]
MDATSKQCDPSRGTAAREQAIEACDGDARSLKALRVANEFLAKQLQELRSNASTGYARGTASSGAQTQGRARNLK